MPWLLNVNIKQVNPSRIFRELAVIEKHKEAEANIEAGLGLFETLGNAKITKALTKVRRTMPVLLNYFDTAKSIVADLMTLSIGKEAFRALCLAWQWRKGVIKSKKAKARQYCSVHEQFYLELAADYLQEDYDLIKRKQEKDWIELLFDMVKEKDPSFFACSQKA